jgi:hypothetical protein
MSRRDVERAPPAASTPSPAWWEAMPVVTASNTLAAS